MMKSRGGFTLVEILIVVVILGILAAIVVPQFTEASGEAKDSRLLSDLQSVRSQIELYKLQHSGQLPGTATGVDFEAAMTGMTNAAGAALAAGTAPGPGVYGPYLQKLPNNPYASAGTTVTPVTTAPTSAHATDGWFINTVSGEFGAHSSVTANGTTVDHFTW